MYGAHLPLSCSFCWDCRLAEVRPCRVSKLPSKLLAQLCDYQLQGGVASSAALAYLLAVIMAQAAGRAGRAVQGVLAARAWVLLSDLSYSAYLYHVQVRTRCHGAGVCLQRNQKNDVEASTHSRR